jgi:hypothetical protein
MELRLVGAELLRADGRTDRHKTKLIAAFRSYVYEPKILEILLE